MTDLEEYERVGDLSAPFVVSKLQQRRQAERVAQRLPRCEVPGLSWAAYAAGEPCPGCGRPYKDTERWEGRGTMHFSEAERVRYDAEEALYTRAHGQCHAHRHSVSGSLTMHCGRCCPWPPLSPTQVERLSNILRHRTPDHELMRWRLRLFCGHVVERTAHHSHKTVQAALSNQDCPECGLDPATIIDAEPLGLLGEPPRRSTVSQSIAKPTRRQLEARVHDLEAELERLRRES